MLTREEIRAVYDQRPEAVIALVEQLYLPIAQLQSRVKELEDRLASNSRNSSKPPSSDGFVKQTRSLREPSTRKSGGQPGHPGATLEQVAEPERIVLHDPLRCTVCGSVLGEVAGRLGEERRQVFELPPLKLEVNEHRVVIKVCPVCGEQNRGVFPEKIPTGASYGAGVKSLLTWLNQEHLVPYERTCQIVADLFGQPVSEGTLQAAVDFCAEQLGGIETQIKHGISRASVAHYDETGMYVEGKRGWLHTASTPSRQAGLLHGSNEMLSNTFFTGDEHEIHRFIGRHRFDLRLVLRLCRGKPHGRSAQARGGRGRIGAPRIRLVSSRHPPIARNAGGGGGSRNPGVAPDKLPPP